MQPPIKVAKKCAVCDGRGYLSSEQGSVGKCMPCGGTGVESEMQPPIKVAKKCAVCSGKGYVGTLEQNEVRYLKCHACNATGVEHDAVYQPAVDQPPGNPLPPERLWPVLKMMTDAMAYKLRVNAHKGRWPQDMKYLFDKLREEVDELEKAINSGSIIEIAQEAADVANYAMFIVDRRLHDYVQKDVIKDIIIEQEDDGGAH